MKRRSSLFLVVPCLLAAAGLFSLLARPQRGQAADPAQPAALVRDLTTVRLRFGLKDKEPTDWGGSATVAPGRMVAMDGWRFGQGDSARAGAWQAQSRRYAPRPGQVNANMPVGDVGVILRITGATAETRINISTKQGDFDLALADLAPGVPVPALDGAVEAERIADAQALVATADEEDFPSAATAPDGTVYVSYVAFTPAERFAARSPVTEEPKDFAPYGESTGGDRVWLLSLRGSEWSAPVPISDGGEDLFRTALAVDGTSRAWVFYSRNTGPDANLTDGDWELYARSFRDGQPGPLLRLTQDAGSDIYPAAATDSEGRVWVVWQAFRGGNSRILAARQEGDGFGAPMLVADTPANEWTPAIAASRSGEVSVAWDTYAKGDYDVYLRTWKAGAFGREAPIAASLDCEARPSLAYDGGGRLWAAWEHGGEGWGKNFGPVAPPAKMAQPLYKSREVRVRVLEGGRWMQPAGDLDAIWPRKPLFPGRKQGDRTVRASFPRLGTDRSGRVWLSARCWMAPPILANQIWYEYVTYPGDKGWAAPYFTAGPTNIMDKRPALVPDPKGELLLVGAGSGRQGMRVPAGGGPGMTQADRLANQPVNSNLYVVPLAMPAGAGEPRLTPAEAPAVASPAASGEPADVRRMRDYRTTYGGAGLRVVRGEFHRHTELSGDGGGDGPLEDMWRYALDAASMDWLGNGDHDNGGREYPWWLIQKSTSIFALGDAFTPMFTYERSVNYPDGHRNVVFDHRGVRPIPRLQGGLGTIMDEAPPDQRPKSGDTQMLYHYLLAFDGICASHTSGTDMGTDWRDNHRQVEPVVEIYQGDRNNYERPEAPRAATGTADALGGWRPQGFVNNALLRGYRLGFECSSDHISTHCSYCCVYVDRPTRAAILQGMKQRHVYGATDNILADVRWTAGAGEHLMGEEFTGTRAPSVRVKLWGTAPFAKVSIIKDDRYVHTAAPGKAAVDFTWTDADPKPGVSYYYVRGEQEDGELVWISPVWIDYRG